MFKRSVFSLIVVLLASAILMGCASPTATPAPTAAPQPAAKPTEPPKPAPTAALPTPPPTPQTGPVYGGTLIVTIQKNLTSLDTPKAWSTMDWGTAAQLLYNGLYVFDKEMKLAPDLAAEMPKVSSDGLVYTILLKKGVKFHNGREVVAADFKYSMERNAMKESGSWAPAVPLKNIVGGQDVIDGKAKQADGIKVVDDYTIEFRLTKPDVYFVNSLTMVTNYVVPREEVAKWGADYGFHPVGTGPFVFKEWIPSQKLVFVRNPNYFKKGLPYLDSVVYELGREAAVSLLRFEKGEVDVLADGIPTGDIQRLSTDPKWSKYFQGAATFLWDYLGFNLKTPPFDKPQVRKAIAMAVNRNRLMQLIAGMGEKTNRLYPNIFECHSTDAEFGDPYPYNVEKAKALLAEAGYPNGFSTQAWFPASRAWTSRIGESLQQDLSAIGVKVELLQLETAVGDEKLKKGEIPMWAREWGSSFPDPFNHVTELFATAAIGAGNRFSYSNPKVDDLISKATATTDPAKRCATWKEIEKILFQDDMPAVPLFTLGWPDIRSPRTEGYIWHPMYKRPWYELLWIPKEKQ